MTTEHAGSDHAARRAIRLGPDEAMRLLSGVPFGRVVFSRDALPAIRPVNHLIDDGRIIVRTDLGSELISTMQAGAGIVVAYEADDIDPNRQLGWSVVATGMARPITDPDRIARYERLLHPWIDKVMNIVIAIEPSIITGIRLVEKER